MSKQSVVLNVNGQQHTVEDGATRLLIHVLRDDLGLVGARGSCGVGMCGACTVLVDGRAMCSCLMLAAQAEGKTITTVEGLSEDGALHPVQQAYVDNYGFQCAYCTPGFILSTVALLGETPHPDDSEIREYLAGNLCRCGSYVNILRAVKAAAKNGREE